jgi:hypothetical protein
MMPVTIETAAIAALQALLLAGVTGLRSAPSVITETPQVFPCTRCYPWEGDITGQGNDWRQDITTLALDVHVARRDQKYDMNTLTPLFDAIGDVLTANTQLSGTVQTIIYPVHWNLMSWQWDDGVKTFGFRYVITVKLETVL